MQQVLGYLVPRHEGLKAKPLLAGLGQGLVLPHLVLGEAVVLSHGMWVR